MKLAGIAGTGSGKLGSMVYSVRSGEQIVRQYQSQVANPSTNGQVEQRAKFKLMSQLSAAMAPVIAIKSDGAVSTRNQFVAINKSLATFANDEAKIRLNLVQLTKSAVGLPDFEAERTESNQLYCSLEQSAGSAIAAITYAAFTKNADGSLSFHDSVVVTTAGEYRTFDGYLRGTDKEVVIYAYGAIPSEGGASAAFGNIEAPTAEQVAKVIATRSLADGSVTATKTKGLTILYGEEHSSSQSDDRLVVSVSVQGNGTVSGAGRYDVGAQCTLVATPTGTAVFDGYFAGSTLLSSNPSYTFEVVDDIAITAKFHDPAARYQIAASATPAGAGTVSGAGEYEDGQTATLIAAAAAGYQFVAWKENGSVVSTSPSYALEVHAAHTLVAEFEQVTEEFSNMVCDGQSWNQNITVNGSNAVISGSYSGSATKVGSYKSNTKPSVGSTVALENNSIADIQGGSISLTATGEEDGYKRWLVSGTGTAASFQILAVYEYSWETVVM